MVVRADAGGPDAARDGARPRAGARPVSTTARELTVVQPAVPAHSPERHQAARGGACSRGSRSPGWAPRERSRSRPGSPPARSRCSPSGSTRRSRASASLVIVWRFTGWRLLSHAAEERAQKLVAIQFFLLAPYVAFEAVYKLLTGEQPETSWFGIAR